MDRRFTSWRDPSIPERTHELNDKLNEVRIGAAKMLPPGNRQIMQHATADPPASGLLDHAIKIGAR